MICMQCQQQGKVSTVSESGCTQTLTYHPVMYNEKGDKVARGKNIYTAYFHCSNGHQWTESNVGKSDE